jgi:S1-C subfamily serine protease
MTKFEVTAMGERQGFEVKPESKAPAWLPKAPDLNPWRDIVQEAQRRASTETFIPTLHYAKPAEQQDSTRYIPSDAAAKVYRESKDAVVKIRNVSVDENGDNHGGIGSGFFVSKDGKIATAYHVVRGANAKIEIDLADGRTLPAHIVDIKPLSDIAVLQADGAPGQTFKSLELADTARNIRGGEKVFVVGHPQGWNNVYLSEGTVDKREAMEDSFCQQTPSNPNRFLIASNVHVEPGNSGGPMLDADGKVIGVMSFGNGSTSGRADTVDDLKSLLGTAKTSDYLPHEISNVGPTGARDLLLMSVSSFAIGQSRRAPLSGARLGAVNAAFGGFVAGTDLAMYDWNAFMTAWGKNGSTAERFNSSLNMGADLSMLASTAFYAFGGAKYRTTAGVLMGTGATTKFVNSLLGDRTY